MRRRQFLALSAAAVAFPALSGRAQQAKLPRIAFFSAVPNEATLQALVQGLADYGYVDGKNIVLDRYLAPTLDAVPEYAARVVASKPDVIMTQASPAPLAVKSLTSTIPILFSVADAAAIGLVTDLTRPGGNLTGTSVVSPQFLGRQVQIFKDILPGMTRMAVLGLPTDPPFPSQLAAVSSAAGALHVETVRLDVTEGGDPEPLFIKAKEAAVQGAFFIHVNYFASIVQALADLALKYRLPSMGRETYARAGMLVGYFGTGFAMNPDINGVRRLGYYVDLILKGAKPSDLPVEQPTDFTFTVNLKTAKALGVTIPPTIIFQATEVIEEDGSLH